MGRQEAGYDRKPVSSHQCCSTLRIGTSSKEQARCCGILLTSLAEETPDRPGEVRVNWGRPTLSTKTCPHRKVGVKWDLTGQQKTPTMS